MEPDSSSGIQGDPGWLKLDTISQQVQILPEETLKEIAKGPLAKFIASCEDNKKVSRVWQSLLKTYSTSSTSVSHTTASSNVISAFLESAVLSKNAGTRQLALSRETWLTVFDDYMNRFDDAKSKPMRQVLLSLVKIMKYQQADVSSIHSHVVDATIPHLVLQGTRSKVKASMMALEVLIKKHAIIPTDLVSMIVNWLARNHKKWGSLLQDDCKALSIDISQFANESLYHSIENGWAKEAASKIFVLGLASWGKYMDAGSPAGSTLATFFENVRSSSCSEDDAQRLSSTWAAPVRHIMLQNMDALETMSNQILHPLFKVDLHGFNCFINTLPLKSILDSGMTDAPLEELIVLFGALQIGKKIGLVHEDYYDPKAKSKRAETDGSIVVKSDVIGEFLLHRESSIRGTALSLLVIAASTTKPITSAAVRAILRGLPYMHAESDAYSRGEILHLTRKLIIRLKGGVVEDQIRLTKDANMENGPQQNLPKSDGETQAFLNAYLDFLIADLRPGASYPRHITALKALVLILGSGLDSRVDPAIMRKIPGQNNRWMFDIKIFKPSLLRSLVDLLLDAYDDVRDTSLSIMKMFPREILMGGLSQNPNQSSGQVPQLTDALARAEQLASNTSRADHAATVACLYDLLFFAATLNRSNKPEAQWWETKAGVVDRLLTKLEEKLSIQGGLFNSTMRDAPLHGFLSALRFIIMTPAFHLTISDQTGTSNHWRSFHDRIVLLCDKIWDEVKPVLCVDTPEGHTDEPVEDLNVGPKDILSYSWRALRESSLLLHATLSNDTYGPKDESGMNKADYEKIGSMSFIHLAELRHKGAFTTVSQTFTACCQRCGQSKDPSISSLPETWYQEVRELIFASASKLTRRSAGLPALVTGILTSQVGGPLFHRIVRDLHEISSLPEKHDEIKPEVEFPQVHAMNCLKDIYSSNRIGPHADSYIMSGLNLSAERLGSPVWTIRNSGLMVFRSLMTRMSRVVPGVRFGFGGESGAEPGARISFGKYSGIVDLLSKLLSPSENNGAENGNTEIATERVFPALELIGEKVPLARNVDDNLLRRLVLYQLENPVLGVREHAARVYASLLIRPDILKDIHELLESGQDVKTQNYLHGKALAVEFALRRFACASDIDWTGCIDDVLATLRNTFATIYPAAESPSVATVLIEILNEAVEKSIQLGAEGKIVGLFDEMFDVYDLDDVLNYLFDLSDPSWKFSSTSRASSLLRRVLAWAMVLRIFTTGRLDSLNGFFQSVSAFDSDAARWLLEQTKKLDEKGRYKSSLISFYSSVILGRHAQDVKSVAIDNLASTLEVLLNDKQGIEGIDLPCDALEKQLIADTETHTRNREMSNAELRLQGCLLAIMTTEMQSQSALAFEKGIRKWAVKLQFALQEETEFTTRYAAASSLALFAPILRPSGSAPRVDGVFSEIYLTLYDMLNDDDEEIRDLTASTASWVLSYSSVSPNRAISLSSMNASRLLATFIAQNYSTSRPLCNKALQYITGQKTRISSSIGRRKLTPVCDLIAELRKESTILFVAEKQNLFIDEIRELDVSTDSLFHMAETSFSDSLFAEVCTWVSDGLSYLAALVADPAQTDGLLGWTSKPEIYELGMRIITIASALISKDFPASKFLGKQQDTLREGLKSLLDNGRSASLHPGLLSRVEMALNS